MEKTDEVFLYSIYLGLFYLSESDFVNLLSTL